LCRWNRGEDWVTSVAVHDYDWKKLVIPIMKVYEESTDGSHVEIKESALVWQYRDADPDFGAWQAKELLDHLESVLANEAVTVKGGQHIVEVKPQVRTVGMMHLVAYVTSAKFAIYDLLEKLMRRFS
jgi:trehalose 6-phosphate synthase/phosphatase